MNFKKTIKMQAAIMAVLMAFTVTCQTAFAEQKRLVPMGSTIGISMSTDGVMVASLTSTENGGAPSPAAEAGLLPGDLITALGGEKISSAEDFRKAAEKLTGEPVSVTVKREEEDLQMTITPNTASGTPELGMWLRDGISGIGTLTYYDPQTGMYGGLGHSICDADSGVVIPLGSGEIMRSVVVEVVRGEVGQPGELHGIFDVNAICGNILGNTSCGIFGNLSQGIPLSDKAIPVAYEREIELGEATVLSNVSGTDVAGYKVEIERIYKDEVTGRSMMIKITDEELLEKTGGIVQGMSGSPIIQNGKLIGAVTHVLVNDPEKGFAVSVEKMLRESETLCESGRAA
jgi:stage IV sporulation protein B